MLSSSYIYAFLSLNPAGNTFGGRFSVVHNILSQYVCFFLDF